MLLFYIMGGALTFQQARALASHHLEIPKAENGLPGVETTSAYSSVNARRQSVENKQWNANKL